MKRLIIVLIFSFICLTTLTNSSWAIATNSGLVTLSFGDLSLISSESPSYLGGIGYYGDSWGTFGGIFTPPFSGTYTLDASNFVNATWTPTSMSWDATLRSPGPSGPNPNQGLIYSGGASFISTLFLGAGNNLNLSVTYDFSGTADSLYDGTRIVINILEVGYGNTTIGVENPIDNNVGTAYEVDLAFPVGTNAFVNRNFQLNFTKSDDSNNWWVKYSVWGQIDEYAPIGSGPSPVPEPSTMLLLASGLLGLVGLRRKFKK
jgi:hypothetical protein